MIECPRCRGTGENGPCFVDGHDEQGRPWGDIQMVRCRACRGSGQVDAEWWARKTDGTRARE